MPCLPYQLTSVIENIPGGSRGTKKLVCGAIMSTCHESRRGISSQMAAIEHWGKTSICSVPFTVFFYFSANIVAFVAFNKPSLALREKT